MSVSVESAPDEVIIPLSKRKLRWMAAGSLMFVIVGAWIALASPMSVTARVIGGAGIAFFGFALVVAVRRLLAMPPGLTLTADGLVDRGNALALGLVRWSDVEEVTECSFNGVRFLVLKVHDPEPYLARGNAIQRMTHRANAKLVGSPVSIASTALSISFDELNQLVRRYHDRYRTPHEPRAELPTARVVD